MDWFKILQAILSIFTSYISFRAYLLSRDKDERERRKELENNEKDASLPSRKKRLKR